MTEIPQLDPWQFQPDHDCPGLYLRCTNKEQRDAVMRALGWHMQADRVQLVHRMMMTGQDDLWATAAQVVRALDDLRREDAQRAADEKSGVRPSPHRPMPRA